MDNKTKKNITATIGVTYIHRNTHRPAYSRVLALGVWEKMPAKEKEIARAYLPAGHPAMVDGAEWVKYRDSRGKTDYFPRDLFEGTRYLTLDDMRAAFSR